MNIKEYIAEIITTIILLLSVGFLFFNTYYYPIQNYKKELAKLSKYYKEEYNKNSEELKQLKSNKKKFNATLKKIPTILKAINDTCKERNVTILKLSPLEQNPPKFEIKIIAKYFDFLNILSKFERLNIKVYSISVDEYENTLDDPKKAITLTIEIIGEVTQTPKQLNKLLEEAISKYKRNPFDTRELDGKGQVEKATNLTSIYKLTGITLMKDSPFATIDNKDYFIGDTFFDKGDIALIEKGRVEIKRIEKNGIEKRYFIEFRKKHKNK